MATMNFSVPETVKKAFNETFDKQNKSAIIVHLMTEAIEEERQKARRAALIDRLLALRSGVQAVKPAEIRAARRAGRP